MRSVVEASDKHAATKSPSDPTGETALCEPGPRGVAAALSHRSPREPLRSTLKQRGKSVQSSPAQCGGHLDVSEVRPWSPSLLPHGAVSAAQPSPSALQAVLAFGGLPVHLAPFESQESPVTVQVLRSAREEVREAFRLCRAEGGVPARQARNLLMASLTDERRPVVLFSGGVDSSLMAALLKKAGRDDTLLVHLSFGESDPDTAAARQIAKVLDLELLVQESNGSGTSCLEAPGTVYPVPFGDISTPPTFELMQAAADAVGGNQCVVIDGTGADGAFGLSSKMTSFERLGQWRHQWLRLPSSAYRAGLWRTKGRLEYGGRIARRIASLPPPAALIAQNSLFGVLYDGNQLGALSADAVHDAAAVVGTEAVAQGVFMDLSLTCARIFAQKTLGPARLHGLEVAYPFLDSGLASLGIAASTVAPEPVAKRWMKELLETFVPRELVYRQKSGFIDPSMSMFGSDEFRTSLQASLATDGVASGLLKPKTVQRIVSGRSLGDLPHGHRNFLWSLAFTDRWYRTATRQA